MLLKKYALQVLLFACIRLFNFKVRKIKQKSRKKCTRFKMPGCCAEFYFWPLRVYWFNKVCFITFNLCYVDSDIKTISLGCSFWKNFTGFGAPWRLFIPLVCNSLTNVILFSIIITLLEVAMSSIVLKSLKLKPAAECLLGDYRLGSPNKMTFWTQKILESGQKKSRISPQCSEYPIIYKLPLNKYF